MTASKIVAAAASGVGGAGLDVDEVFSTFLYDGTGTGSNLTVTNNIDLSTEGGLVWVKRRDSSAAHALFDTVRGQYIIESQSSGGQDAFSAYGGSASASYNTNGFGINGTGASNLNSSGAEFVSWTFRKAKKFFDVVTWTGNGSFVQTINHNLGCEVGAIFIKRTDTASNWVTAMRISSGTYAEMYLNTTGASLGNFSPSATSTYFNVGGNWAGDSSHALNASGGTYVAYLFAHNNNDGGFGPDADQDIIKCGSYTGNGSATGPVIDLGFEPQLLMVKRSDAANNWVVFDSMRGFTVGTNSRELMWNLTDAEQARPIEPTSTGFQPTSSATQTNASGGTYIYMAIRRGPLAAPEDATKVFAMDANGNSTAPTFTSNFTVDMGFISDKAGDPWYLADRLRGPKLLRTESNTAEATDTTIATFDHMNGWGDHTSLTNHMSWMWKRAPSFFDVICHNTGSSDTQIKHNLGVTPELAIYRNRSGDDWKVMSTSNGLLNLNSSDAATGQGNGSYMDKSYGANASATHINGGALTGNNVNLLIFLFASLSGVSKIGEYTGNGTGQNIECGFSSGARFILIKRTSGADAWYLWDSVRGIVSGNDPYLRLNLTAAEESSTDRVDPYSGGFAVTGSDSSNNGSGETYLFYAIA